MKLERALNNAELISFYEQFTQKNQAEFRLTRNKDFFAPYRLQSDDYRTYVLRNIDQEIQALASFVFKETDYLGERKTVATALDLRVAPSRKAILPGSTTRITMPSITAWSKWPPITRGAPPHGSSAPPPPRR